MKQLLYLRGRLSIKAMISWYSWHSKPVCRSHSSGAQAQVRVMGSMVAQGNQSIG
jgi:hypothetical protein